MRDGLKQLFLQLQELREAAGMSVEEAEEALIVGPGWVQRFEGGEIEPTIQTLAAIADAYGSDLATLFEGFEIGEGEITIERHLSAEEAAGDLVLSFPMGQHSAKVELAGASMDELNDVLLELRNLLALGLKREAIVACYLKAVRSWPHLNPSDLWYFLVSHAYQDSYNHPATEFGRDWSQSWKRASGWAFEAVLLEHYNPHLSSLDIQLEMPTDPARKTALLADMQVNDVAGAQKADVIAIGTSGGIEIPFGVIHVKASLAERRTDDVPLSQQLIAKGFASPLVTMDCKASPSDSPHNRGEFGSVQGSGADVTPKRLDIEQDRKFDAGFSFNGNTLPTPAGQAASARISVVNFADPDDAFSRYLLRKWEDRQGI